MKKNILILFIFIIIGVIIVYNSNSSANSQKAPNSDNSDMFLDKITKIFDIIAIGDDEMLLKEYPSSDQMFDLVKYKYRNGIITNEQYLKFIDHRSDSEYEIKYEERIIGYLNRFLKESNRFGIDLNNIQIKSYGGDISSIKNAINLEDNEADLYVCFESDKIKYGVKFTDPIVSPIDSTLMLHTFRGPMLVDNTMECRCTSKSKNELKLCLEPKLLSDYEQNCKKYLDFNKKFYGRLKNLNENQTSLAVEELNYISTTSDFEDIISNYYRYDYSNPKFLNIWDTYKEDISYYDSLINLKMFSFNFSYEEKQIVLKILNELSSIATDYYSWFESEYPQLANQAIKEFDESRGWNEYNIKMTIDDCVKDGGMLDACECAMNAFKTYLTFDEFISMATSENLKLEDSSLNELLYNDLNECIEKFGN